MDYLLAINPGIRWSADWTSDCSRYLIPGADGRGLLPDVFWFGRNSAQFPSIFVGGSVCCAICRRRPKKKKKHNFAILVKWQGLSCVIIVNRYERYSKQKKKKKNCRKKFSSYVRPEPVTTAGRRLFLSLRLDSMTLQRRTGSSSLRFEMWRQPTAGIEFFLSFFLLWCTVVCPILFGKKSVERVCLRPSLSQSIQPLFFFFFSPFDYAVVPSTSNV